MIRLGTPRDVGVMGDYAYIADGDSGLQVIDISVPQTPTFIGNVDTPGNAYRIFLSDNYAFIADDTSGCQIIDVSNPGSPGLISNYSTPGNARGVYKIGELLYIADGDGIHVVNISNPMNPTLAGSYNTPGSAMDVHVIGEYAYVADYNSLIILRVYPQTAMEERINSPNFISLEQNYPNPFNATTTIGYNLNKATHITIEVFDILGRRVEPLVDEKQPAGDYQVAWDSKEASSGIYFYRIQVGEFFKAKKMLLIK
jgi:hypothetical protein